MQHPSLHPEQDHREQNATPARGAVAASDDAVDAPGFRAFCIPDRGDASPHARGGYPPWSHEADMAVSEGEQDNLTGSLGGPALARNQTLLAQVRTILARRDVAQFGALMDQFSELLEPCGPLGYVRFEEEAFAEHTAAALHKLAHSPVRRDPEALCDALHVAVTPKLCCHNFLQSLRDELQTFLLQPYVPRTDRLPACAALLTLGEDPAAHALELAELPALYAIFRAQLVPWLEQAGKRQEELLRLALALRGDA